MGFKSYETRDSIRKLPMFMIEIHLASVAMIDCGINHQ